MKKFRNRKEAGILLGKKLEKYKSKSPVVIAIPRGGVETGYYIALRLNCKLSVIVARKLGFPERPEAAFGAIAEDGSLYLNPWEKQKLSKQEILIVMNREKSEMERRVRLYRKGKPIPDLKGRTAILVDDGIATGATLFASIEFCKKKQPDKIVVAVPVAASDMAEKLLKHVDDAVILYAPENFYTVSQAYEHFESLDDDEVVRFLQRSNAVKNLRDGLQNI